FESDDPAQLELARTRAAFGEDDNLLLVHVRAEALFSVEGVAALRRLHEALGRAPHVLQVDSLVSAYVLPAGRPYPEAVLPVGLEQRGPEALAAARALALSDGLLRGRLVAEDG